MSDFLLKIFEKETINKLPLDKLYPILESLDDEQLQNIATTYSLDIEGLNSSEKVEKVGREITGRFAEVLNRFDEKEHKSFYDFYNGSVDYSDENVYLNMKKFTALGYMYLFLSKSGTYFNFVIPVELIEMYEDLLARG